MLWMALRLRDPRQWARARDASDCARCRRGSKLSHGNPSTAPLFGEAEPPREGCGMLRLGVMGAAALCAVRGRCVRVCEQHGEAVAVLH
ncbi:unspecified product [Leishmania tarentolae]|uniref:Unspecified product n=1 Tax=Leishmania tarentolae TaxID=5689 RepID=A0A640KI26_LEITA|nr:unspecified product [Leishmania tarentolae]